MKGVYIVAAILLGILSLDVKNIIFVNERRIIYENETKCLVLSALFPVS